MSLLSRLFLGDGAMPAEARARLESEGLIALAENCPGRISYSHFKAPGKRFHGKVTPLRIAIGVSRERLAVYSNSGRAELIDSPFAEPNFDALEISLEQEDRLLFKVDYGKIDDPKVSGVITIRATTPEASSIAAEIERRLGR